MCGTRVTRGMLILTLFAQGLRETEGGRTFLVTATRQWNNSPLNTRTIESLNCFKNNLRSDILKDQGFLHHFSIVSLYIFYL